MTTPAKSELHPKANTEAKLGQCPFMRRYLAGEAAPVMMANRWTDLKATWINPVVGEDGRVGFVMRVDLKPWKLDPVVRVEEASNEYQDVAKGEPGGSKMNEESKQMTGAQIVAQAMEIRQKLDSVRDRNREQREKLAAIKRSHEDNEEKYVKRLRGLKGFRWVG